MSPQENKQTRDRDPPDLFASPSPRVSLPQMSYIQGNAFARMKAKERERQRQLGESGSPSQEQTPRPSTSSGRRSNGLDYDQELALPMPKPRHLPPTEAELAEVEFQRRSTSTHRSRLTKKRSGDLAADSPTDSGKKSKVASLRSKFSLKDLAREFRRENSSPPPAVPSLRKSSSSGIILAEGSLGTPRSAQSPPSFDKEGLYVPKARGLDTKQPSSAPPGKSSFQESLGTDRASQSSMYSSPPTIAKGDKKNEKFRHAFIHEEHGDSLTMRQTQTGTMLETLLLDGSSPPAHTGELRNAGHPEVMSGQRICSMKAEQGPTTPVKATGATMPAAEIVREYSPSIYDDETLEATSAPKAVTVEQNKPATDNRQQRQQHPMIVSSDQNRKKKAPRAAPSRSAFVPSGPRQYGSGQQHAPFAHQLDPHQLNSQMSVDEARFFTGISSHGGFAPPPPHPGYQNTTTVEQHVTSHANSIHHHLDTALGKLTRNTESNINWSTDQLIRQVESVTDMARTLNTRTVNQADTIREIQQSIEYLRMQVSELQHQSFRMENKLVECIHTEIAQVRADIRNLPVTATTSKAPHNTAVGWSSSHGESQGGGQYLAKGTKEYEKRQNSKKKAHAAMVPKSEEMVKRPEENKRATKHNEQSEFVVTTSAGNVIEAGKRAEKQEQTCAAGDRGDLSERDDNNNLHSHPSVPPPTIFHTPPLHKTEESSSAIDREIRRAIKDPRQESSGSPTQKGSRPGSSTHNPLLSPEDITDANKMVFGFGRSDKDKKAKKTDKKSTNKGSKSSLKEPGLEPKEAQHLPEETVSKAQDVTLETEGEHSKAEGEQPKIEGEQPKCEGEQPKIEGELSTEQANSDAKSENNEAKTETKSLKADIKDVKSTPNKKHKKGMFSSFKRNRDGNNQSSSSGFLRTPQRHKENKATDISAPIEPVISQPIPIPHYDLHSTEGDPAFVHPALRTPRQKAIMAERERLGGLARQQSTEQIQQQPSGQTPSLDQHLPFGPNPLFPHHIPGTPYRGPPHVGHPPVTFRPSLPGRQQQPAPFTHPHPHPPSFGQAPQAIVSHYYGPHGANNSLATSSLTGAPNVMMPPRYQPGMPFTSEGIDMRRWYQETRGHASPETGEGQGNASAKGNN